MSRSARQRWLPLLLALALLSSCRSGGNAGKGASSSPSRHTASREALGTTFRLTVYAADARQGNEAVAAALRRLDEVDTALNADRADSEVSRLNAASQGASFKAGNDLFTVLQQARRLSAATRGSFDVTAGPYRTLWRNADAAGRVPSAAELEEARLRVGWDKLTLNPIERSATLTVPRMQIDLSGIARGYAADQVFRQLRAHQCEASKVDGGTVIVVGDAPPGGKGWSLTVHGSGGPKGRPPTIRVARRAIAFSPNTQRRGRPAVRGDAGKPRLIDPVGGRSLDDRPPTAVLATSGAVAESVAYAAAVLGPERADVVASAEGAARIRYNLPASKSASRRGRK
jgi:thiamine biosynthesis lipoprotein